MGWSGSFRKSSVCVNYIVFKSLQTILFRTERGRSERVCILFSRFITVHLNLVGQHDDGSRTLLSRELIAVASFNDIVTAFDQRGMTLQGRSGYVLDWRGRGPVFADVDANNGDVSPELYLVRVKEGDGSETTMRLHVDSCLSNVSSVSATGRTVVGG